MASSKQLPLLPTALGIQLSLMCWARTRSLCCLQSLGVLLFETGSHYAVLAILELCRNQSVFRLKRSTCFCLLSAAMKSMHHHPQAQLLVRQAFTMEPKLVCNDSSVQVGLTVMALVSASWVLNLQGCTTKPSLRNHFKMSVTLDSLVGEGLVLIYCGLKRENRRSGRKTNSTFQQDVLLFYVVLNQRIKPLYKPLKFWPILFQTLDIQMPASGSYIFGNGEVSLIFKFQFWSFKMN